MDQIDNLRLVKTPAGSAAPSAATSPDASGSNSPAQGAQMQLDGVENVLRQGQGQPPSSISMPDSKVDMKAASAPGTPHFGAQSEL